MTEQTFQLLENYMLSQMTDSAHDKDHIYRVLYNAMLIAQNEADVASDVLITACLLHDVGRQEQFADPSLCHAVVGAQKAYDFLTSNGFDEGFSCHVRDCIRTHRFRKSSPPQTIEAKILFDADKLDVVGAMGIARTLLYKGNVTEPLYNLNPDGTVSNGENDDRPSFFHEYKFKLEKLYSNFYTQTGKALAAERQSAAVNYYNDLLREVTLPYTLGKDILESILLHEQ
ncbi:MAG: HD domain-containing protein [Clostridia bacterium]|nr:HD domain-containing protein [Clostridia bacterium]